MAGLAGAIQATFALALLLIAGWWALLATLAIPRPRRRVERAPGQRLAVIIPAHNEQALIGRTLAALAASVYEPRPLIVVVADNCTDRTAEAARSAGATVVERNDETHRGKPYALEAGLAYLRAQPVPPAAIAVVDADTEVDAAFFGVIAGHLARGARVVQAHYRPGNDDTSLASLRRLAFGLVHWARPLGASRLGLPTTLKGNGMAFAWEVVHDGMPGRGVTEDAEATLALAERGITVTFAPETTIRGQMAAEYASATVQDERWEGGRLALMPRALRVGVAALLQGRVRAAAAAFEVAAPPLTLTCAGAAAVLAAAPAGAGSLRLSGGAAAMLALYVVAGLAAARPGWRDLAALWTAPRFIAHKAAIYAQLILRGGPGEWRRTERR